MTKRQAVAIVLVGIVIGLAMARGLFLRPQVPTGNAAEGIMIQEIMATRITVRARGDQIDQASEIVFSIFREVDERMSEWKASSPLSAVNAAAGMGPVAVPEDLRRVVRRGIEIGQMTDGAFDITWAALWGLWDFKSQPPRVPTEDEISSRLGLIDYASVRIDDEMGTVFLPREGMLIGLGGIAKGYALDRAGEALREAGVTSFLISAGGQVLVGEERDGRGGGGVGGAWRIGIRDPRGEAEDYFAQIDLANTSLSTSGDYERFFVVDGVRYHHVLDPRTGRPSRGVRSVTVISADATLGDALSTSLMLLGVERGLSLVESLDDVEAIFVDDEAAVHLSGGLVGRINEVHPPVR